MTKKLTYFKVQQDSIHHTGTRQTNNLPLEQDCNTICSGLTCID